MVTEADTMMPNFVLLDFVILVHGAHGSTPYSSGFLVLW